MPKRDKILQFSPVKFILSIVISLFSGVIGSVFTFSQIPTWYVSINKPVFSPPNWVFGPVWTTLYILMGIALYIVWNSKKTSRVRSLGIKLFAAQLVSNALWSIVFFGGHQIFGALIVIVALLTLIILTTKNFFKVSRTAGYLMLPYILWVSFATFLNLSLFILNR